MLVKIKINAEDGSADVTNNDTYFASKDIEDRAHSYKIASQAMEKAYLELVRLYAKDNTMNAASKLFGVTDLQRSLK